MCSWAPEWWAILYFMLAFMVPAVAVWMALKTRRSYLERHEVAMPNCSTSGRTKGRALFNKALDEAATRRRMRCCCRFEYKM